MVSLRHSFDPVLIVSCDRKLTQRQPSSWLSRVIVGPTAALMSLAAVAMFVR